MYPTTNPSEFVSDPNPQQQTLGSAAQLTQIERVQGTLDAAGIDYSEWGKGTTKDLAKLLHEIEVGEARLEFHQGRLFRVITVARIDVRYDHPDLGPLKLIEERQVKRDGSSKVRANPFSVWEKTYPGEPFDGENGVFARALREELGVTGKTESVFEFAGGLKDEAPQDYPGLWTRYAHQDYRVKLTPEQYLSDGYREVQEDKTTYFAWRSAHQSEAQAALLLGLEFPQDGKPETNDKRLERVAQHLVNGIVPSPSERAALTAGICGRVLRGKSESDFETLSSDPHRRCVLLLDEHGIDSLLGKTGREICSSVLGYTAKHIEDKFGIGADGEPKNELRIVLFPTGQGANLATWERVIQIAADHYPHFKDALFEALPELASNGRSFAEYEKAYGIVMDDVERVGESHPRFMNADRFAESAQSAVDVRAFLYFVLHLRENFTGTGEIKTDDGSQGPKEYVAANRPLTELGEYSLLRIPL